jgi:hypothetical protein
MLQPEGKYALHKAGSPERGQRKVRVRLYQRFEAQGVELKGLGVLDSSCGRKSRQAIEGGALSAQRLRTHVFGHHFGTITPKDRDCSSPNFTKVKAGGDLALPGAARPRQSGVAEPFLRRTIACWRADLPSERSQRASSQFPRPDRIPFCAQVIETYPAIQRPARDRQYSQSNDDSAEGGDRNGFRTTYQPGYRSRRARGGRRPRKSRRVYPLADRASGARPRGTTRSLGPNLAEFAQVKSQYVPAPFPTWTILGIVELARPDLIIEIEAVAAVRS